MRYDSTLTLITRIVLPALCDTLYMAFFSTITSISCGFILGVILVLTDKHGLKPNKYVYAFLSTLTNIIRSMPFVILVISIIPLTRFVMGKAIGPNAAIFAITIAASPLVCRLIESSLKEVNPGLIEAAKSFGASDMQILKDVLIRESVPSIISNMTLAIVSILGSTAMAGVVGAGGLGAVALTYGYQNFDDVIMYSTIFVLVIMVQIIQFTGNILYRRLK